MKKLLLILLTCCVIQLNAKSRKVEACDGKADEDACSYPSNKKTITGICQTNVDTGDVECQPVKD